MLLEVKWVGLVKEKKKGVALHHPNPPYTVKQ
jgi:hypothetical protein